MTKKNVLRISSSYIIYFILLLLVSWWCRSSWCQMREDDAFGFVVYIFLPLAPVFLFSLITYKMHDNVFRAWWNFARWFVPIIIAMTVILNNSGGGGTIGMNQDFTFFILGVLYTVLVIVSLAKIYFAYGKK